MRTWLLVFVMLAPSLGGCLRQTYDLCDREEPHPECDAGPPSDSGASGDAASDAGDPPSDAGDDVSDAGDPPSDAGDDGDAAADTDDAGAGDDR